MKATRAAAAAAQVCSQEMLLQRCELVASYCSSPQRRDPTISGLSAPSVTTYPTNSRLPLQTSDISRVSSLSPLTSPNCKRPKYPHSCLVESKTPLWQWVAHFTWQPGSSGSTTKVRTFSFPVVPVRHPACHGPNRPGRASPGLGPGRLSA